MFLFQSVAVITFAQITHVPDDNFEQALIDLGYDTGVLDDSVLTANIEKITFLDVRNKSISDVTGIQYFETLLDLQADENNLSNLDIS